MAAFCLRAHLGRTMLCGCLGEVPSYHPDSIWHNTRLCNGEGLEASEGPTDPLMDLREPQGWEQDAWLSLKYGSGQPRQKNPGPLSALSPLRSMKRKGGERLL